MGANKLVRNNVGTIDIKNLSNMSVGGKDMMCFSSSESGHCHILSQKTKQLLFSLKMNGSCNSAQFSSDSRYLFTAGDQAEIYQWDLRTRKCISKIQDQGAFHTTTLAVSPDDSYLATGSKMGSVNIYRLDDSSRVLSEGLEPTKSVMNLTTSITDL